jgi:hypothetical protein
LDVELNSRMMQFHRSRQIQPRHGRRTIDAKPTATKSCAIAVTADVNVGPLGINGVGQTVPDEQEIERRRNLVRTLFNDFWSGVYEKPAAFVERLDQAEDYLNERLAASGEIWRLNTNTRLTLGLPPRSNSSGPQAAKCVDNRQPDRGRGVKPFVSRPDSNRTAAYIQVFAIFKYIARSSSLAAVRASSWYSTAYSR